MTDDAPLRLAFLGDPNSVHTRRWIAWFAQAGHDVRLIDPFATDIEPGLADGVVVERYRAHRRRLPLVSHLAARGDLRRILARADAQVLHAHFVRRFGWQAALSGFHPLVVSPWGSDILRAPGRAVRTRAWNRFALGSADLVTVSSEGMRRAAIRAGASAKRTTMISHGVDTDQFSPGPADEDLARQIGADGAPIVVSPRSIRALYRQEVVVDAVAAISTPERRPLLVMSARGADADYHGAIRARAEAGGIADRLRILDDVPHERLPALFRLADVVVSVPETDSFSVTMLEAMACGAPVVASDLPAVTPVLGPIDPVASELIVPVGDARATAAAIDRGLRLDGAERSRLGERLRSFVRETADYDTNMATMEGLYRRLAAGR
ncbi:MAG TPA: glycosyltransferase family 4 protein [Candidatus Limnocylindria bacterium]